MSWIRSPLVLLIVAAVVVGACVGRESGFTSAPVTPAASATPSVSAAPSGSAAPSTSAAPSASASTAPSASASASPSPSATPSPSAVPSASPSASPTGAPSASPSDNAYAGLDFECFGIAFPSEALLGPATPLTGPAAAELNRFLADEADPSWPRDNWRRLAEAGTGVLFGTLAPDGSEAPALVVTVRNAGGTWQTEDYGACTPAVLLGDGVGPASWTPGQDINATTVEFEALVTERSCASGQSSEGRVVEPRVISTPTSVTIIFGVTLLEGPQDCQGNEPSRYPVRLPAPLGDRELLDGGVYPAQEVDLTP